MLKQKHPEGEKSHHEALLTDIPDNVHHVKFDSINADKTQGGAGQSGMDAEGWKHILTLTSFGKSSTDLCKTFADVIKTLCTSKHRSTSFEEFLACRLITSIRNEIISSVGSLQVCAGHDAGC